MSLMKRTFLYLCRKKGKTIILFLMVFIISAFVLTCFSILNTVLAVGETMRTSIGAAFHIRASAGLNLVDDEITADNEHRPSISQEVLETIMQHEEVKYYNANNSGYVKSKGIEFISGIGDTDDSNMGGLEAVHYTALDSAFLDGVLELAEGRHITADDTNGILISEELAAANGLSVGDNILLTPAQLAAEDSVYMDALKDTAAEVKAEIIGIYKIKIPQGNAELQPTGGLLVNQLYTTHELFVSLGLADMGEYRDGASFYIKDPKMLDDVLMDVRSQDILEWEQFFIRMDDFNYKKIEAGLSTIQNLVTILLVCVSAVSLAILILILAMRIRNRVHEAGILMSLGLTKGEIVGQLIAEVVFVALIAFLCSYFAAAGAANRVTPEIFKNTQSEHVDERMLVTGVPDYEESEVAVNMPIGSVILIYIVQLIIISAAVILSSLAVIRLKPREILSKMS